ncbi:hypothetical protein BRCON_1780 [Candidatus Sumerlaea chitinivorans]|uniref:Uncharacterized protein n=1 Tax=Sumerlaea chitinivorans TaxID=2250252 RepID=A0A2Z4Y5R9_SUMC1|nr:hypothetical protein BRCON_1780 [Candidatus Sumerlaea chitinivorans]
MPKNAYAGMFENLAIVSNAGCARRGLAQTELQNAPTDCLRVLACGNVRKAQNKIQFSGIRKRG